MKSSVHDYTNREPERKSQIEESSGVKPDYLKSALDICGDERHAVEIDESAKRKLIEIFSGMSGDQFVGIATTLAHVVSNLDESFIKAFSANLVNSHLKESTYKAETQIERDKVEDIVAGMFEDGIL